jgi:class 3 adenylate cyclase
MREELARINTARRLALTLRVGLHSGPVVAGIIGCNKFSYDLWGDTVNTASRMESSSHPGEIQISAATAALLGDAFLLESRGLLPIKGLGEMETFWLRASEGEVPP